MSDCDALADFVATRSAEAFAVMVRRHVDLVYATARRITGNLDLAEEVTQVVFIVLAQRAQTIRRNCLAGWLVNTARLAARDSLRAKSRRQKHETKAASMRSHIAPIEEPSAEQISPLLDEALSKLNEIDRTAVVMRFLEGRNFDEVATAIAIKPEAARKRVSRALEKMREHLMKQQVNSSVAGLSVALASIQSPPAPVGLIASATQVLAANQATSHAILAKGVAWTMKLAKLKTALIALGIIAGASGIVGTVAVHQLAMAQAPVNLPAPTPAANQPITSGEVYIGGHVKRAGVYSLTGRSITLRQLIPAAGGFDDPQADQYIQLVRKSGRTEQFIYRDLPWKYLVVGAEADVSLMDQDTIMISTTAALENQTREQEQNQKIYPHDRLRVTIKELTTTGSSDQLEPRVDPNGKISLPFIGQIKVQNITLDDAAKAINKAYSDAKLLPNASAKVEFEEIGSQIITQSAPFRVGDHASLSVWDLVGSGLETTKTLTVAADGTVTPALLQKMKIEGLSEFEAEQQIAEAYRQAKLIPNPMVVVQRDSSAIEKMIVAGTDIDQLLVVRPIVRKLRTFAIIGYIKQPGEYLIAPRGTTLSEAIGIAHGFTTDEEHYVELIRATSQSEQQIFHALPASRISQGVETDVLLQGQDKIFILAGEQEKDSADQQRKMQKIFPHDRLRVTVKNLRAIGSSDQFLTRVDPNGRICLPLVGSVKVTDATIDESKAATLGDAAKIINKTYSDHLLLLPNADAKVEFDEIGPEITVQSAPLHVGDHVLLKVWDLTGRGMETVNNTSLDNDGTITPPRLGKIEIEGLSEDEAQKLIVTAYRDANLIPNAAMTIQRISAAEAERQ
jgi:RNA polymerase sigma factor (sigma-70 family)